MKKRSQTIPVLLGVTIAAVLVLGPWSEVQRARWEILPIAIDLERKIVVERSPHPKVPEEFIPNLEREFKMSLRRAPGKRSLRKMDDGRIVVSSRYLAGSDYIYLEYLFRKEGNTWVFDQLGWSSEEASFFAPR